MFLCSVDDLEYIEGELGTLVEKLQNKAIFLTGATGFIEIGRASCRERV